MEGLLKEGEMSFASLRTCGGGPRELLAAAAGRRTKSPASAPELESTWVMKNTPFQLKRPIVLFIVRPIVL
jgi:hypothetical protein